MLGTQYERDFVAVNPTGPTRSAWPHRYFVRRWRAR